MVDIFEPHLVVKNVITDVVHPDDLIILGNDLFIAEFDGGKITRANLIAKLPRSRTVIGDLYGPGEMVVKEKKLYISCFDKEEVRTFSLSESLLTSTQFNYFTGLRIFFFT